METSTNESDTITLLIPYITTQTKGEELKVALRTWAEYYQGELKVVIVGDNEDWFSNEIVHIPAEPHMIAKECGGCITPVLESNPQADVVNKMAIAILSGQVQGDFIMSNDDIFLLGCTYFEDIAVLKYRGSLEDGVGKQDGIYRLNGIRTKNALLADKLPILNYGTHTPMLFNADQVMDVIAKYDATNTAHLFSSLYYNNYFPKARPIYVPGNNPLLLHASVYRALNKPEHTEIVNNIFKYCKSINVNDDGWSWIKPILQKRVYSKSKFEK